jgi:prepilin-type N-terminal cleavage/methylation domain-containing protein
MSGVSRRSRDQQGFTLVETIVTTAILAIVVAILAPLVTGALTTFTRQNDRTGAIDQVNLVLQQLEHDVTASSTLNVASPSDLQLIAILPSTTHDTASCVEYKLTSATVPQPLALQRRTRVAGTGVAWPSSWQTLLTPVKLSGQAAGSVIPNPAGASLFTSGGNGRSVNIDLQVQNGGSPIIEEKTTATGRTVIAGISGTAAWTASCS